MSEVHITLYGDHADRFKEVQAMMEQRREMGVSNAQALRNLLANFD